jgi:hypothetical protein
VRGQVGDAGADQLEILRLVLGGEGGASLHLQG